MKKRFLLIAALCVLVPAVAYSAGEGVRECTWGTNCSALDTNLPVDAGSTAGGGLYEGASIELMQINDWMTFDTDFMSDGEMDNWFITAINGGTGTDVIQSALANGIVRFDGTGGNETGFQSARDDGGGEAFYPAVGRTIIMELRIGFDDWDTTSYMFGLTSDTGAALLTVTPAAPVAIVNGLTFFHEGDSDLGIIEAGYQADGNGYTVVGNVNSTKFTDIAGTVYDFHTFGIRIEGRSYAEWYVDGVLKYSVTLGDPLNIVVGGAMAPFVAIIKETAGDADRAHADFLHVRSTR